MFYQKYIRGIFMLFISCLLSFKLEAQEFSSPKLQFIGKVDGGNFIFDDVYDLTYNPVNHSVALTNGDMFGFIVISLDSLKIVFDNRKIKRNRFSIKSDQSIIFPFKIKANSRGNFVFYDFSYKRRLKLTADELHIKNYLLKEIKVMQNNAFAYESNIQLNLISLKSIVNSDPLIVTYAVLGLNYDEYVLIKQDWVDMQTDTIKLASLSKLNLEYNDYLNHNITTYKNDHLLYFNNNRFIIIKDSINISEHAIEMPNLDTSWSFDIENGTLYETAPVISVFEMGEKVCFFYRSKIENDEARYFISIYSFESKTTEKNFEIPKDFCYSQTNPLPVAKYDDEHLLLLRVHQGFYEFYTLKL